MANFKFKYKDREKDIDVKICDNIFSQARGLMFRQKSKPLLFDFGSKKRRAIHSFFCVPFIAIWFQGDKIIEIRKIMPWKLSVKPREKFDKLLEIPSNDAFFDEFLDEGRKL